MWTDAKNRNHMHTHTDTSTHDTENNCRITDTQLEHGNVKQI